MDRLENEMTFTYKDSKGNVTKRKIVNFKHNDDYFQGFCTLRGEVKTFRKDRIIEIEHSVFTGLPEENTLECHFINKIKNSGPVGKQESNEICFTGFISSKKNQLIELANKNGFLVRKTATNYLDFLVCGPNAGTSKIEKAKSIGTTIMTENEFYNLLDNGELPDVG